MQIDFTKDFYTQEKIDIELYKNKLKLQGRKNGFYFSIISKLYHEEKYKKSFYTIISEFFYDDIPKCPIKNIPVSFDLRGKLIFTKFCPECTKQEINIWNNLNNKNVISFHEKMKVERKGEGNPVFGTKAWNNGISPSIETIKKQLNTKKNLSDDIKKEIKKKQSISAKKSVEKFPNRGMAGKKHSDETKEKCRQATIKRIKEGKFPQTDTSINKIFENLLIQYNLPYEKEFPFDHFVFDFKVKNYLIEIQGDYWHCNPNIERFKNGFKNNRRLQNNYGRDIVKKMEVEKSKFEYLEFWEYDLNNNLNEIKQCIAKLLM